MLAACLFLGSALLPAALAAVTPVGGCAAGSTTVGTSITDQPGLFVSANWVWFAGSPLCPPTGASPAGTENAVITASYGGPTGMDFGILSSGDVAAADDPDTSGSTTTSYGTMANGGNDVTVLRVDVNVPATDNCLLVDVQFLSEEYPEYVGSAYNDALIVELDFNTWTVAPGGAITAPNNFAVDGSGNPLTVNSVGAAGMSASDASGSTFDGATPRLAAQTPISAGPHSIFFSVFDAGDSAFDSAGFADNMRTTNVPAGCTIGVTPPPPPPPPPTGPIASISLLTLGTTCIDSSVSLTSVGSTDADGTIVSYFWILGDGATATSTAVSHVYSTPGPHTVTLTVTDDDGFSDTTTFTVADIGDPNCCPTMTDLPEIDGIEGDLVTFTVSATDYEGDPITISVEPLPGLAQWDPAGILTWQTKYGQAGTYVLEVGAHQSVPNSESPCPTMKVVVKILRAPGAPAPDADKDGISDLADNCPSIPNVDQADADGDGVGDVCDAGQGDDGASGAPTPPPLGGQPDSDFDGWADGGDDCPSVPDVAQRDLDGDRVGDACDADVDGDGVLNLAPAGAFLDNCPLVPNPGQADANGDHVGDLCQDAAAAPPPRAADAPAAGTEAAPGVGALQAALLIALAGTLAAVVGLVLVALRRRGRT